MNLNLPANVTYQPPTWAKIGAKIYNLGLITYITHSSSSISIRLVNGDCCTIYKSSDQEEYAEAVKMVEALTNPPTTPKVTGPHEVELDD